MAITEEAIFKVIVEGEQKLINLEKRMLSLRKSLNTAIKNENTGAIKGARTKMRNLNLTMAQERNSLKQYKLQEKQIKTGERNKQKMLANTQRQALSTGLAFLFTGMAFRQYLISFAQGAFEAFNKYTANTELANNATNRLAGAMEYLNFTVGAAFADFFEKIEPAVMNLVEGVANFVEQHPNLVAVGTVFGIILTTLMMVVGQIGLFMMGAKELALLDAWKNLKTWTGTILTNLQSWVKIGWTKITSALSTMADKLLAITKADMVGAIGKWWNSMGGFITKIGLAIVLVGVLIGLFTGQEPVVKMVKNFVTGITFIIATFLYGLKSVWDAAKKVWENIKTGNFGKAMNPLNYLKDFKIAQSSNMNLAKEAAWDMGDTFEIGMKKITDTLGTTEKGEAWNNVFKDISSRFSELTANLKTLDDNMPGQINVNVDQQELIDINKMQNATSQEILNALQENNRIEEENRRNSLMSGLIKSGNVNSNIFVPFSAPNQ